MARKRAMFDSRVCTTTQYYLSDLFLKNMKTISYTGFLSALVIELLEFIN